MHGLKILLSLLLAWFWRRRVVFWLPLGLCDLAIAVWLTAQTAWSSDSWESDSSRNWMIMKGRCQRLWWFTGMILRVCRDISGAFGWNDNYVDTRPADTVDVNWEVGKKYVVGQRDSTWLLHEMGFCLEGLSSTVRQNLVYGDPRCASRVIVWSAFIHSLYMRYRSGLSLLSRLETLVASVYSPEEMLLCWNPVWYITQ